MPTGVATFSRYNQSYTHACTAQITSIGANNKYKRYKLPLMFLRVIREARTYKVNASISGQRTIPDTLCIAPKNESTRTHFSIFIIPIRIAIHTRNFKAIRCFVPGLVW